MFQYGGYAGKLLWVDLTSLQFKVESLEGEFARRYLGGNGFGARLLWDKVKAGADPLGEDNVIVFAVGPVQGTSVPGVSGRLGVISKSPLTGGFMDSYVGGDFGARLKYAGWDAVIISGIAERPCYLLISEGKVQFKDASELWGLDTYKAQARLRGIHGWNDTATLCIGPAGENLVPIASIISGVRAAGRGGLGAVMGSKRLKAIVVQGSNDVRVASPEALQEFSKKLLQRIAENPGTGQRLPNVGTQGTISINNDLGILGTRNWQDEQFRGANKITGAVIRERAYLFDDTCFGCPIGCGKVTWAEALECGDNVDTGRRKVLTAGPEYETLWAFGANYDNDCLESIIAADRKCDELGLDTISTGSVIGFAAECFERGIITVADTGGLELKFGNTASMLQLIDLIGLRKGIGALLGMGVRRAAQELGRGAEEFAIHVKGLELAAHSARSLPGMAVGYATSNRGGSHQDGRPTAERIGVVSPDVIEGKGKYIVDVQRMTALCDCLIHCRMTETILGLTGITEDHVNLVRLVTGMEVDRDELILIADRVYNLERAFNVREGFGRSDDWLPQRLLKEPVKTGPRKGKLVTPDQLNALINEVYLERGWDLETGRPTRKILEKLGLEDVAESLAS